MARHALSIGWKAPRCLSVCLSVTGHICSLFIYCGGAVIFFLLNCRRCGGRKSVCAIFVMTEMILALSLSLSLSVCLFLCGGFDSFAERAQRGYRGLSVQEDGRSMIYGWVRRSRCACGLSRR
ncbi:uncharacterized protein IWZ02DRAFT_440977 [Phyllosticta citriasiana]|uniref:uncharacterized protein n=1 Tax=Phyllosticta citriasiana TaxID=595635 RepID=UPI0030FDBAEB